MLRHLVLTLSAASTLAFLAPSHTLAPTSTSSSVGSLQRSRTLKMAEAKGPSWAPPDLRQIFNLPDLGSATSDGTTRGKKTFKVAVTGASGLIGTALVKALKESTVGGKPVGVVQLKRGTGDSGDDVAFWDPEAGVIDKEALEGVDAIIHLAGENVASGSTDGGPFGLLGAWTDSKKKKILDSRRLSTSLLANTIATLKSPPKVFICASAVGYYGFDTGAETLDETSALGKGFLAEVSRVWEEETAAAKKKGVRVVNARFGVVFSKEGGLIKKLYPLFALGGGGVIGSGNQYLSWVSLRDAVRALQYILERNDLSGPVNVVAPAPVTNTEFTKAFGKALFRPTLFPFPAPAAKIIFGDMGDEMLLGGQKVVPSKLLRAGFSFSDPDVDTALKNL